MTTVSYAGRNIKWNNANDAKKIKEEILSAKRLVTLVLEGNTLGIEAAKEIGIALAGQPKFQRALWRDLFTGRLKDEIPQALKHLFCGVIKSGAKLKELDLSDNALGPLGVEGITEFLKSSSCYSLRSLCLNNNGLGIKGGHMLAESLLELAKNAKEYGKPLNLKIFIAGRNRLENEGAIKFAEVFSEIQTLEKIVMPQNGIFFEGIAALAKSFSNNSNLQVIDLNDNTFTQRGARAMAKFLPTMRNLKWINFGDCLLKTAGALHLASALKELEHLKVLNLESNEIRKKGALAIIDAIIDKESIETLMIAGNQFGSEGRATIRKVLMDNGKESIVGYLDADEEPEADEEEEEDEDDAEDTPEEVAELADISIEPVLCDVKEFIENPTVANLLGLRDPLPESLVEEARRRSSSQIILDPLMAPGPDEAFINECTFILMTTSSLLMTDNSKAKTIAETCIKHLAKIAFERARETNLDTLMTNNFLVNYGLLKSENKHFKIQWDLRGALLVLPLIARERYFPNETRSTLQFFFSRPAPSIDCYSKEKHEAMKVLFNG